MESIDLTGLWKFHPDMAGMGEGSVFGALDYDDAIWRGVQVPSDFETCHPSLQAYEGGAWYRRSIGIPGNWEGRRIVLHFEGVYARIKVWCNGLYVGAGSLPYLPLDFEIQDYAKPGEDNVLVVWVDNMRLPGEVPGKQRGWRTFGGLLREVSLQSTDLMWIDGFATTAEPCDAGGLLTIHTVIRNRHSQPKQAKLVVSVSDKVGKLWENVELDSQIIKTGSAVVIATDLTVAGAHLWSPETPHLFSLDVTLMQNGEACETKTVRIGFRSIEARKDKVYLNGLPIVLTGFNRHEDSINHNMCTDMETARNDLKEIKAAGANFVRLCHYPHHPGEVDICDELGLLVMDEIPLYWWDGLAEGEQACIHKLQAAQDQLKALIQRDRNHPSVVFWSVSNETEEGRPEVVAGNDSLVQLAQTIDPTRLAVHVSNHWQDSPHFEYDDVICVNGYPSWWEKVQQKNSEYQATDGGENWRKNIEVLHNRYPDKPILVTEFGFISLPNTYGGPGGEDVHAKVIAGEFAGMNASYVCGATVWCWADHPWPAATFDFANYLGLSPFGVVARNRRKKQSYWVIKQLFRNKQGIVDSPKKVTHKPGPAGYGVFMVRHNMENIPQYEFPDGYGIRQMRLDEGGLWTDIWRDADPLSDQDPQIFHSEFGHDYPATTWRSYMVTDRRGLAVGVISAWYNQHFRGDVWGQIHWVALRRRVQGKGLGKAMMSYTMNQLAQWNDRAYLGTQTNRLPAIKNYLDFGFLPSLDEPGAVNAWRSVAKELQHPTFKDMGLVES